MRCRRGTERPPRIESNTSAEAADLPEPDEAQGEQEDESARPVPPGVDGVRKSLYVGNECTNTVIASEPLELAPGRRQRRTACGTSACPLRVRLRLS
jgi:hypothetical protein